ncbi:FAS1-like dehydratase domain-containing protein [Aeromicrobium yanjiei]|uniref:FAS1-like dehydratase domain-containing protein n=1 Tax=Aeromicrobium yanjiei TaxID=2662028 RepID=A0A5Q2MEH0_9ACTN|nr:MaoC family dehydratase N-terminal domain-containing protein [Aeromicrobium yanjiei]QGG40051.1 hypothetical protein GEV26_00900 [Aeromicrobium yanjiei]
MRPPGLLVDPETVHALADLLGADDLDVAAGAPLPPLWHWAALARWRPWASLGRDGHAEDGSLPTRPDLPRRMFAGGSLVVHRPLRIGSTVHVSRSVQDVKDTEGRSGPLRFVTVRDVVEDQDGIALEERQDIVYRPAPTGPTAATPREPTSVLPAGPSGLDASAQPWTFTGDAPLLMRFSALTRNTHRIHYDHPYATGVEGYEGLVVHGPLLAIVLAETVRRSGAAMHRVDHRGRSALIAGHRGELRTEAGPDSTRATLSEHDRLCAEITVHHHIQESP